MYNQHTREMAITRHRSLVERGGKKALLETLRTPKKNIRKNPIFTHVKQRFEHIDFQQSYSTISYKVIKATSINTFYIYINISWSRLRREKSSSQSDCEGGQDDDGSSLDGPPRSFHK